MTDKTTATDQAGGMLLRQNAGGITTLTLNRPDARNCLCEATIDAIARAIADAAEDPAARAVIIAANGPAFCSGHDLREMTARRADGDGGRAFFARLMAKCSAMMQSIVNCPKPVIAQVQGPAAAAGVQLVATCDLAVAGADATFTTPGVHIGLFCSTPMVALSRNLSSKHAMDMLLTGNAVTADRAERIGLVNMVAPPDDLARAAREMAGTIASKSMKTLATGKQAFYRQAGMPLAEAYDYAAGVMVENMMARDAEEGIGAFIDKRPARWQDR